MINIKQVDEPCDNEKTMEGTNIEANTELLDAIARKDLFQAGAKERTTAIVGEADEVVVTDSHVVGDHDL